MRLQKKYKVEATCDCVHPPVHKVLVCLSCGCSSLPGKWLWSKQKQTHIFKNSTRLAKVIGCKNNSAGLKTHLSKQQQHCSAVICFQSKYCHKSCIERLKGFIHGENYTQTKNNASFIPTKPGDLVLSLSRAIFGTHHSRCPLQPTSVQARNMGSGINRYNHECHNYCLQVLHH